jgi:uncharacterized protein YjiS (DUF1127 family)
MLSGGVVHGGFQITEGEPKMTTTTHTNHTAATTGTKQRHWIVEVLSAVARLVRHRREAAQLLEMDDHNLADIGLSRSDVIHAMNSSPLHDPTRELSRLAGRRP